MPRTKHSCRCLVLLLTVLLGLGLGPRQGSAHNASGGTSTVADHVITTTEHTTLLAVTFEFSAVEFPHLHHCVATASAEAVNPTEARGDNKYIFVLSLDSATPITNHPSARTIDSVTHPGQIKFQEVSSTFFFKNIASGHHVIRWMARKVDPDNKDLTVRDSSLTVVCTQNVLE